MELNGICREARPGCQFDTILCYMYCEADSVLLAWPSYAFLNPYTLIRCSHSTDPPSPADRNKPRLKTIPDEDEKRRTMFWELVNMDCRIVCCPHTCLVNTSDIHLISRLFRLAARHRYSPHTSILSYRRSSVQDCSYPVRRKYVRSTHLSSSGEHR